MGNEYLPPNNPGESKAAPHMRAVPSNASMAKELLAPVHKGCPWLLCPARTLWLASRCWLRINNFSPGWLPEPLRHPAAGYLAALLIEAAAVLGSFLLIGWCPEFAFKGLLPVLALILVALGWGAGPGLLATLWGALLLDVLVLPPPLAWDNGGGNDLVSLLLFLVVGYIISMIAGQNSWSRRRAEEMTRSVREEQARTERERLRLRTLFDVLPAAVGMVDAQGHYMERTPACKALWGEAAPMPREISDFRGAKAWRPDTGKPLEVEEWALARALANGEIVTQEEVEIETSDGERKFVLDSANPIRDETGAIIGAVGILQDITERRRLEEALRQAEREAAARASQLEAVFEAMTEAVLVFDKNSRILQRNAADRRLFAYDIEPATLAERRALIKLRNTQGQTHAEDQLFTLRALKGELLNDPHAPDFLISTASGEDRLINVTAAPVRDAEGQIVGGVMVMRDVTERRQLEREIARRASELEAIFETIVDGIFVYDTEGHIIRTNSAGRRLWNLDVYPEFCSLSQRERMARYPICFEHDKHLPEDCWPLARMLRGEVLSDPNAVDVSYSHLDGHKVEGSITGAPLRDADGRIIGAVMVLRDLTERQRLERRAHEALQALLAMAEALVQAPGMLVPPTEEVGPAASPIAHRLAQLTSNVLGCPHVSISTLDLEEGTSLPLAVWGLSPDEEQRWWAGERRSARWTDGSHAEVLARLQAGETLVLDMTDPLLHNEPNPYNAQTLLAVPMRIGERLVGLLILDPRDATHRYTGQEIALAEAAAKLGALVIERERLLREREAARASELALRQANRQMDTFLGMASHELKTPLTTIILGLQLSQRRIQALLREEIAASNGTGKKLEALEEQLARTSRQAGRLDRLVNDLLDVSRIQADKLAFRPESADLATIIGEVVQEQRQANPQRCIQVHLPGDQSMPIYADAGRIEQVVTNYLTNALKYSAEDEPVELGVALEGGMVRLWVRDHGPGIPQAEQEHLWERFHRVPGVEVRSGSGVGLGLGLFISRAIIERHHGQVGVESLPGEGATFWFRLPLSPS
jgi:PAS domain S-box-containing protein